MTWNEGYFSEINYTAGFYGELNPAYLAFAALLKSVQPTNINQEFTYCELGCGLGYSSNILAAAYPHGQFYATDFNPNHIAIAQSISQAGKLNNIHFFNDSFKDFLERDLPEFDFISLHGIYSWISKENRQVIVQFIKQKLKVGGLVYISYNALPGWASFMPLRELLSSSYERQQTGSIVDKIKKSLEFVGELLEANPALLVNNPQIKDRYQKLKEQNPNYLAHEYFNKDWEIFYVNQVAQDLNEAKVKYLCSANFIDHIDTLNLTPKAQQILATISDPLHRELTRDYFLNTQFRRDIYIKGAAPLSLREKIDLMENQRFAMIVPLSSIQLEQQCAVGKVSLNQTIYKPICDLLATQPLTIKELKKHEKTKHIGLSDLFETIVILIGLGYLLPAFDEPTYKKRKEITDKFNQAIEAKAIYGEDFRFLASPLVGSGIACTRIEQIFLLAKTRKQESADFAWQVLANQNEKMIQDGKVLETPEENIALLKKLAEEFAEKRLPLLQYLGIA